MGGVARMSGIPYRPKDEVPVPHGGTSPTDLYENQPEPVTYDKDGIVYPKTSTSKTDAPAYSSQYYANKSATPQVTNAKTVSTETVAEARAAAKARKVQEK